MPGEISELGQNVLVLLKNFYVDDTHRGVNHSRMIGVQDFWDFQGFSLADDARDFYKKVSLS